MNNKLLCLNEKDLVNTLLCSTESFHAVFLFRSRILKCFCFHDLVPKYKQSRKKTFLLTSIDNVGLVTIHYNIKSWA